MADRWEDLLEGSAAGTHDRVEHLLRVGPATGAQKNTFRPSIYPVACWRIDDLRFEFDSSFIRPQARKEFRKLHATVKKHPEAPLSIFGHADPAGTDDYNKRLSGRRAQAVYGALVREPALWEAIYSDPYLGDQWGTASLTVMLEALGYEVKPDDGLGKGHPSDALKRFQQDHGMVASGQNTHATRAALFEAYMDWLCGDLKLAKNRFLARGADAKGKGDYQGCSESNPVLLFSQQEKTELEKDKPKRNQENAPNRRVMIFLFRPGSYVNPGKWPCPRASEGIAGCKLRWWSDGEKRRSFQALRRKYEETHDTFACRFYDRMASKSPCEGGLLPPLPTLRVYLKLMYLDPEKNERVFPPDMPVYVQYAGGEQVEKVGADGLLSFDFDRARDWFTLRFEHSSAYVASAAPDCKKEPKERYILQADVQQAHQDRYYVFRLPKAWSLKDSEWPVVEAGCYNKAQFRFEGLSSYSVTVGAVGAPSKMVLDPHWHFLRFEFFDRYYGHKDHGDKRISIPPLLVDGFRTAPAKRGPADNPDTHSNWWINEGDAAKQCQALPWILAKPDAKILLQFRMPAKTFVVSEDKDTRKIATVADDAKLKPSAARLKLYDLPPLWKSTKYYTRGVNKFFDELKDAEVQSSAGADQPLIFSLDDMVLTDQSRHQVSLAATDRVAVFFHGFDKNGPGKLSNVGLYEFDDASDKSYYSKIDLPRRYYIHKYPDWTRLVAAQGNLWDVFLARTPDEDPNDVVGARAAIRWVDHAPMVAAGTLINARPARVERPSGNTFFALQPYTCQFYPDTDKKFDDASGYDIGRNDHLLLRCCGRDDADNELFVSFHYFRYHYTWNAAVLPDTHPPAVSKYAPPTAANQGDRDKWVNELSTGVADRWNGHDTHNTSRAFLLPQKDTDKIKGTVVFFLQPMEQAARAHYTISVVRMGPGDRVGWMNAGLGTGQIGDLENTSQGSGWYTMAHESGHGDALPDEYNELWDNCSGEVLSITGNLPGDPFIPDSGNPDGAMMKNNRRVRNRHLWHAAEFSRDVTKIAFQVEHGAYKYLVPPHPSFPRRTYAYWPIQHAMDASSGGRDQYDLYLYTAGKDRYTVDLLANGPFDGILVIAVRMRFTFWFNDPDTIKQACAALWRAVYSEFNWKWYATGKVRAGTAQEWEFKKCQLLFSPRFLVSNNNTGKARYNELLATPGVQFRITVNDVAPNPPNSHWSAAAPSRSLILECADPATWLVELEDAFKLKFCAMLGMAENLAGVNEAALLPIVRRVITTNAKVEKIT